MGDVLAQRPRFVLRRRASVLHGSANGRTEPYPCWELRDPDILRASEVQHTIQQVSGDGHLGRLSPIRLRA